MSEFGHKGGDLKDDLRALLDHKGYGRRICWITFATFSAESPLLDGSRVHI